MNAIWTLATKDLRLLVRDRAALFWVLCYPLITALAFGSLFGGLGGGHDDSDSTSSAIPVVLVDEEKSLDSHAFAEALAESKSVAVSRAATREDAKRTVLAGDAAAYVALVRGFDGANFMTGASPDVEIGIAPTNHAEGAMLRGIVLETSGRKIREKLAGSGTGPGDEWEPIHVASVDVVAAKKGEGIRPATTWEITFPSSILWALLAAAATFASSVVAERTSGTWVRLRTAPLSRAGVLAGKALACGMTCLASSSLLLVVGVVVFGVRVQNPLGLALGVVCGAACFVGLMMLLAVSARTERAVSGISWGVLVMLAMFGGGMVPLFVMPPWMQHLASISPVKWGILAIEGAVWRGFSLADFAMPCAMLVAFGAVAFALGVAILRRQEN